jgi:hypothetical protein
MSVCCPVNGCDYHSVTSAHVDMAIDNNGTWSDAFQFGTPGDFTWTLTNNFGMDVQANRYDATPLLQLSTTNGRIIVDDAVQRVIHLNVAPADIQASLRPGVYVYDLVMMDGSTPPIRTPLMHGHVRVGQGVTYP